MENMKAIDEKYQNGFAATNNNNSEDSDDGCDDTTFENLVMKFFRGFSNVSNETIRKIRDSQITYKDLSALGDEDLELFGIKDAETRREMITKLSNTLNQTIHFDKFIEEMTMVKYQETVYTNVRNQLRLINNVLEASQTTLKANPITYDRLVENNVYISSLNKKALKEILIFVSFMTDKAKRTNKWNRWLFAIVGLTGLTLLSSIVIFRKIR